jgi:hypothetical protein
VSVVGDWLRPVLAGLVATVIVAVLAALATTASEDKAGWRRITPSPIHWTGIALGTGLVLLMVYVRLFVGSTRADAAQQMAMLTWLIAAFALMTIAVAWSVATVRRSAIRWRGSRIAWRHGGREATAELGSLTRIRSNWLGQAVLHFGDGVALTLDRHARGATELLEQAEARLELRG